MLQNAFYRECLQAELERKTRNNPRYSLRAFGKALGLSPATLSQIISGKRVPSLNTARKILSGLGLPDDRALQFLQSVAQVQRARGLSRLNPVFRKLKDGVFPRHEILSESFADIAAWYHYAILELTLIQGFQSDSDWIARTLEIPRPVCQAAIERLLRIGLLSRSPDGKLAKTHSTITTSGHDTTTAAFRRHQAQILERAIESLERDPIDTRCMHSMTIAIASEKIPAAKELIRQFTRSLAQLLEAGECNEVYQLGIALYPVSRMSASPAMGETDPKQKGENKMSKIMNGNASIAIIALALTLCSSFAHAAGGSEASGSGRTRSAGTVGGFGTEGASLTSMPLPISVKHAEAVFLALDLPIINGKKSLETSDGELTCNEPSSGIHTRIASCKFGFLAKTGAQATHIQGRTQVRFAGEIAERLYSVLPPTRVQRIGVSQRGAANLLCSRVVAPRAVATCVLTDVMAMAVN